MLSLTAPSVRCLMSSSLPRVVHRAVPVSSAAAFGIFHLRTLHGGGNNRGFSSGTRIGGSGSDDGIKNNNSGGGPAALRRETEKAIDRTLRKLMKKRAKGGFGDSEAIQSLDRRLVGLRELEEGLNQKKDFDSLLDFAKQFDVSDKPKERQPRGPKKVKGPTSMPKTRKVTYTAELCFFRRARVRMLFVSPPRMRVCPFAPLSVRPFSPSVIHPFACLSLLPSFLPSNSLRNIIYFISFPFLAAIPHLHFLRFYTNPCW